VADKKIFFLSSALFWDTKANPLLISEM